MKRLAIAAVGLALVVGIVVGGMVGNPFGGKASAAPPNPAPTSVGACFTNWNSADCPAGWTAASVGEWTTVIADYPPLGFAVGGSVICASPKQDVVESLWNVISTTNDVRVHYVNHEACAICCK